ncbi:MAG: PqqD family protein [Pseudomonadota bacterium]
MFEVASDSVISKEIDGEVTVIDLSTGIYYAIEGIGAQVWLAALAGQSRAAITAKVAQTYSDDAAQAAQTLLDDLVAAKLLVETQGANGADAATDIAWPGAYAAPVFTSYDDVSEMVALDPPLPELPQ